MKKQKKQSEFLKIERNKDFLKIEGYKIKKNLGWVPILIVTPILILIFIIQGADAFGKSANVECPLTNPKPTCTVTIGQEIHTLERGETKLINDQNTTLVKTANYLTLISLIITGLYNHIKYNRN